MCAEMGSGRGVIVWFGVWGCASHELRFASRLGWALDVGWFGVVQCSFEFRRIFFGGNVWGMIEVVGVVRIGVDRR